MRRFAIAMFSAMLAVSVSAAGTGTGAVAAGIDIVAPPAAGGALWSGDRLRGARERLKDILPGSVG